MDEITLSFCPEAADVNSAENTKEISHFSGHTKARKFQMF
jgi:hypothetical protein